MMFIIIIFEDDVINRPLINILSYFDADQVVDIGNEAPGEVIIPTAEGESESVTQSESASETAQTSSAENSVTEAETVKE